MVYAGPIFYAADADGDLLRAFREWAGDAPDEITALVNLTTAPPLPVIPAEWHGKKVAAFIAVSDRPARRGEALVSRVPRGRRAGRRPARADAVPGDADADRPALAEGDQRLLQGDEPRAARRRADRPRCAELHLAAPGPQCEIHVHQMGGAVARRLRRTPRRSPSGRCRSCSTRSPAGTTRRRARRTRDWARDVIDAAADASTGRAYVNFLGDADAARSSYGDETYARLAALKNEYDPTQRVPAQPEHRAESREASDFLALLLGSGPHGPEPGACRPYRCR